MADYAEDLIKLKQHIKSLSDALLHKRYEEVPSLVKSMKMRLCKVDDWIASAGTPVQE